VADLVLMLGPLYHLTESNDRVRALGEARRVLKAGGRLLLAAISRSASALDGLSRELFADPRFGAIVTRDLRDGQHRNSTERLDYFTTAYFHRPDELARELTDAGLAVQGVYGIEGPGWLFPDIGERMQDDRRRTEVLHVARLLESEPSVLGASAHMLAGAVR
jgi:SAM-dependent methyltransferase